MKFLSKAKQANFQNKKQKKLSTKIKLSELRFIGLKDLQDCKNQLILKSLNPNSDNILFLHKLACADSIFAADTVSVQSCAPAFQ